MTLRPGKRLLAAAVVLTGCALAVFVWPAVVWPVAASAAVLAALAAVDALELKRTLAGVAVRRAMPSVVGRGLPFGVQLAVSSASGRALNIELRDTTPSDAVPALAVQQLAVPARGTAEAAEMRYTIPIRGRHEFGPVWVRIEGALRLLEGQRAWPCPGTVKVLPEAFSTGEGLQKDERAELMFLDKATRVRQSGPGTEFEMLDEFRVGDDPRRIDWRTTVRARRPIVRRFQIERHRDVMIIIDCGRLMGADAGRGTKLDCAVDSALMVARVALEHGDRCGVGLFGDEVVGYLPPVSGRGSLRRIAESIYDVQPRWRESDFAAMFATLQSRQAKRSLVIVLSDIGDVETSVRFRTSLAALSQRHVVLFAALRTPLLDAIVKAPVETLLDGSRKAVTFRILRERELAIHSLSRGSVHVLDIEPLRLTVPLINRFVELRQRNLL